MPRHPAAIVVPLLALAAGCSRPAETGVAVSGRVTYRGKPVHDAVIFFTPDIDKKGKGGNGPIRNGYYSIPADSGPFPGEFNVMVVDPRQDRPDAFPDSTDPILPERYRQFNELRVVIPANRKSYSFDFDLIDGRDVPRRPLDRPAPVE